MQTTTSINLVINNNYHNTGHNSYKILEHNSITQPVGLTLVIDPNPLLQYIQPLGVRV